MYIFSFSLFTIIVSKRTVPIDQKFFLKNYLQNKNKNCIIYQVLNTGVCKLKKLVVELKNSKQNMVLNKRRNRKNYFVFLLLFTVVYFNYCIYAYVVVINNQLLWMVFFCKKSYSYKIVLKNDKKCYKIAVLKKRSFYCEYRKSKRIYWKSKKIK